MFKKILLGTAILASTVGIAAAAGPAPYIGAGLGIATNTPSNNGLFGSNRGTPFNILAGYGGIVSGSFYLAGELNGTVGTAVINDNGSLKTTYSYGASILPGVMLSDHTLAFARAGIVRTRFSELSQSVNGGQFGFGLQTGLTQSLDLRGEYDFTAYRSVNMNLAPNFRLSTSPRQDAFTLSLVYKFE
jgi:opacity protein-like surface antigen